MDNHNSNESNKFELAVKQNTESVHRARILAETFGICASAICVMPNLVEFLKNAVHVPILSHTIAPAAAIALGLTVAAAARALIDGPSEVIVL